MELKENENQNLFGLIPFKLQVELISVKFVLYSVF